MKVVKVDRRVVNKYGSRIKDTRKRLPTTGLRRSGFEEQFLRLPPDLPDGSPGQPSVSDWDEDNF